jgi:hypothetical protein
MTHTGNGMEREELIATICVIQAMNVFLIPQWERNGMILFQIWLTRYRRSNVHLGTKNNDSFQWT